MSAARPIASGTFSPLRFASFRRAWGGALSTSLGVMMVTVAAAWKMTALSSSAELVALVQTCLLAPAMLLSLLAGAIADLYDRRRVELAALTLVMVATLALAAAMATARVTPALLLGACFFVGTGMALFGPSWQGSVREHVPAEHFAAGIALNAINVNVARVLGPAIGGAIIAAAGVLSAIVLAIVAYVPLLIVTFRGRGSGGSAASSRERLGRAVLGALRLAVVEPALRRATVLAFTTGVAASVVSALLPVVTRELLHGEARVFGTLMGAFGAGSVLGALLLAPARRRVSIARITLVAMLTTAACIATIGSSHTLAITVLALAGAGVGWMLCATALNVTMQSAAPSGATARTVALYQTSLAGGMASGSWAWGRVAEATGASTALWSASLLMTVLLVPALAWKVPVRHV